MITVKTYIYVLSIRSFMKVLLFHSPTCPHCPPARDLIKKIHDERKDFELIEYLPSTIGAKEKYVEFNVASTPTFIIQGPGHPENIGLRGKQSAAVLNKYLDIAAGKRELEPETGFLVKLMQWIKKSD